MTELSERGDIRVLPYAPGTLERVLGAVPYYRRATMRKGALRGLERDTDQPGVLNLLVAHPRVADETVAAVVRAIAGNAEEIALLNPLFDGLDGLLRDVRAEDGVALHPGAAEAYRALGLMR